MAGNRDREGEIQRKIERHLELEAEALQHGDEPASEARRRARLAFGNPVTVHEDVRAVWARVWLERLVYDVRHAVRLWMASPALAAVAILTIALGIGASTAIVGQINAVFWTPLSVTAPAQLRQVTWSAPRFPYVAGGAMNVLPGPELHGARTFGSFSYPAYEALRDGSAAFSDLACWGDFGEARPVTLGELGFGSVQFVTGNYFRTVGVHAALGRTIQPGEDTPEQWAPVAMIGYRFWQRVFGVDPAATSRTLKLNGRTFAIVGVVPESFTGLDPATPADVFLPIGAASISAQTVNPLRNRGIWSVCRVVGRLRADATEAGARAELEHALSASIAVQPPAEPYDPPRVHLADGSAGLGTLRDAARAPLGILLAAVGTLLVAACANIAGLLLARGGARQREIATRLALGAPRARLVRQLLTESLVLSTVGGAIGVALAYGLSGAARTVLGQFMPTLFGADRQLDLVTTPDVRVLGFALAATLGAALLFGVAPALQATRVDLIGTFRQVTSDAGGRRRWAGGRLPVALQVALGVVLLVGTGMFLRTVANLRAADLGFPAERLLYARVEPRSANLPPNQRGPFFQAALDRIQRLPGVTAASAGITVPYGGDTSSPSWGSFATIGLTAGPQQRRRCTGRWPATGCRQRCSSARAAIRRR